MGNIVAFPYYGGKNTHLTWLKPLIPYDTKYIEPFCGSAALLLNRNISPMEVINDKNEQVINFFEVLRTHKEEFVDLIRLTPYSKSEHEQCMIHADDPIERARRFFVFARQSFMGQARTWAISPKQIRGGFSQVVNRWINGIEGLLPVIIRLKRVCLENRDAIDIIPRYDSEDTVFYCDPPYVPVSRTSNNEYAHEMSNYDHEVLIDVLLEIEGKVGISNYDNELYNKRLKDWNKHTEKERGLAGPRGKRTEILYTNYDPYSIVAQNQTTLETSQSEVVEVS